ncbi:DNA repair protein RecN [Caldisalinibacter kiritimatiensis]|uniref:DNA repair protein RecN n=1 Tax=Caldisalinibacter kiritimatiensis TaxID=1304284 RepID=R1CBC1_9FIRM|nr:DNA repair protein RecN [Caldisalinibacter kiritimatiensis]EOC99609.1 DNA repair protein RecN [Caldisalinibacter kiritimatiensis]
MLLELNIKNFVIIDELNISFDKGFNVFTGETGAGKSIIIDAMNIVLGGRATKEFVRTGEEKAAIDALFNISKINGIEEILEELGIDKEQDNTLLISRQIYNTGRSIARINGRTVTLSMLKKLTSKLVDIHGQHEHQSLLSPEKHVEFIDSLGSNNIRKIKNEIVYWYDKLKDKKKSLESLSSDDMERERKIDLLKFQIEEIDNANLKTNEEEELIGEYKALSNTEDIIKTVGLINEMLCSDNYRNDSVIDRLSKISSLLTNIAKYDNKLDKYLELINDILYQLQDISIEFRNYQDNINYDEERLKFLENRIELINNLKRKYGQDIKEIIKYKENIEKELDFIINSEKEIKNLKDEIKEIENILDDLCKKLTIERKKVGKQLEINIINELKEMNLKNVIFKIKYDKFNYFTRNGIDKIEFLISTNPGEPLRPLSKIVSGGEMSRIMLSFKNILAEVDNIHCLVFDEIDTGISGRTAQIVAEKISKIAKTHQILCVTHLPQIASMADSHFLIEKNVKESKTVTSVHKLDYEERIDEMSRLLGGVNLTDTTRKHAEEMLKLTKVCKNSL